MDSQLEEDLAEALDGCNPIQFVLKDPCLAEVAEEVYNFLQEDACDFVNDNGITESISPMEDCTSLSESNFPSDTYNIHSDSDQENSHEKKKPTCVSCNRPAKGYQYFGAVVCDGCRAFFSRSIKGAAYKSFACIEGCDSRSWKKCRHCRFNRLRDLGMRVPGPIVNPAAFANHDGTIGPSDKGLMKLYMDATRDLLLSTGSLMLDEKMTLEKLTSWHVKTSISLTQQLIRRNSKLYISILEFFYHGKKLPIKTHKLLEDYMAYWSQQLHVDSSCWGIPDMLTAKDRARLVAANFPLVYELVEALKISKSHQSHINEEVVSYVDCLVDKLEDEEKKSIEELRLKISQNGSLKPVNIDYEMVYNLDEMGFASDQELLKKHWRLVNKISSLTEGQFDPVVTVLNCCIILYTPGTVGLENEKEAERLQMVYASLLHRYLKDQKKIRSSYVFRESMLAISYLTELREIRVNAYKKLKL